MDDYDSFNKDSRQRFDLIKHQLQTAFWRDEECLFSVKNAKTF